MRKAVFFTIFTFLACLQVVVSSFAMDLPNRTLFIEGSATESAHMSFFMTNFGMEAAAMGFMLTENKAEAGFTFKFNVQNYQDDYDRSIRYIILISLIFNETGMEMVSFGWPFGAVEDMYEFNQFVFYRAAVLIPSVSDEDIKELVTQAAQATQAVQTARGRQERTGDGPDTSWQKKLIYLRASFDYPITFYALQPTGLIAGAGVYGEKEDPDNPGTKIPIDPIPLDNKVLPQFGVTLGLEIQPFKFLSVEANVQVTRGEPTSNDFYNLAAGAQLNFVIRTDYIVFKPYAAIVYHFNTAPIFTEFPEYAVGGGVQIGVRGGRSGSFFLNINYMTSFTDAYMKNEYVSSPEPPEIHYKRFVVGLGIGYKHGFVDFK
jgi:hypothetical protein